MSGPLIDVLIVLMLGIYAYSGYRSGLMSSIFSLAGFFGGALVAVWTLPALLERWDAVAGNDRARIVALVAGVLFIGWIGQTIGNYVGVAIRRKMAPRVLRRADSVLGAVAVTVAAALVLWFMGGALRTAGNPTVARAISDSRILQGINTVMPDGTEQVFARFRTFLSNQGFPQVFGGLTPEPIVQVQDPDPAATRTPAVAAVAPSIVKLHSQADSCAQAQEGTGWVVSSGRVVTNAHVVAGATRLEVSSPDQTLTGTVVIFDPARDLAVVDVPGLNAPPLALGAPLKQGDTAVIPGYPLDGPYSIVSARVRSTLDARGGDIYGNQQVLRQVYSLNTTVRPGNSGGPLIDPAGKVVGVVFAKSLEDPKTGYALTLQEAAPVLQKAPFANQPVGTGSCLTR